MRRTRGFTLIELLVVISVIAILAAMLLPALSLARDKAKSAVCQSQQKNISLAIEFYVNDDWNDRYPVYFDNDAAWGTSEYCPAWPCFLLRYVSYSHDIYPQMHDRLKVFHCPATDNWDYWYYKEKPTGSAPKEHFYVDWWYSIGYWGGMYTDGHFGNDTHWEMPYGANEYRMYHTDRKTGGFMPYRKHIKSPDLKYVIGDTSMYMFARLGAPDGWPATRVGDSFVPRHQMGCNIIYIDGHVKWSSYKDIEGKGDDPIRSIGLLEY